MNITQRALETWWQSAGVRFIGSHIFDVPGNAKVRSEADLEDLAFMTVYDKRDLSEGMFRRHFAVLIRQKRWEFFQNLYESIKFPSSAHSVPAPAGLNATVDTTSLALWVKAVTGKADPIDIKVMQHFIWQVKRKALGGSTDYEMMPVLVGPQGSGKTRAVSALLRPVAPVAIDMNLSEATDERKTFFYDMFLVVVMDELAKGGEKLAVDALKKIISSKHVSARRLYSNSPHTVTQRATFIGSSNFNIGEAIWDSSGMRRFYQIDALATRLDWDVINSIDYFEMWRLSVDENQASPIMSLSAEEGEELFRRQDKHREIPAHEFWFGEQGALPPMEGQEGVAVSAADVFNHYKQYCISQGYKHHINPNRLSLFLQGRGVQKKRTSKGNVYMFMFDFTKGIIGLVPNKAPSYEAASDDDV